MAQPNFLNILQAHIGSLIKFKEPMIWEAINSNLVYTRAFALDIVGKSCVLLQVVGNRQGGKYIKNGRTFNAGRSETRNVQIYFDDQIMWLLIAENDVELVSN